MAMTDAKLQSTLQKIFGPKNKNATIGVTDVSGVVQETLLGKRRDKKGYQDTRVRAGAEAPATSWYKTTLG